MNESISMNRVFIVKMTTTTKQPNNYIWGLTWHIFNKKQQEQTTEGIFKKKEYNLYLDFWIYYFVITIFIKKHTHRILLNVSEIIIIIIISYLSKFSLVILIKQIEIDKEK